MTDQDTIQYRPASPSEYEAIRQFLSLCGWAHRVADADRFRRMMAATQRTVVAWEQERVVGFARALCDNVSNGYISMVAVAPERRGRGIGRSLIEHLIGDDTEITWVLRAGRGSEGFWEHCGFQHSSTAMEKARRS